MKYCLVTTKNGQFPINEIKEGTEVLSHGNWVKAPVPVKSIVITCTFDTLPTTSFEKESIINNTEVYCNHQPVLNEYTESKTGLSVRAYLRDVRRGKNCKYTSVESTNIQYWYPRLVNFFGKVVYPNLSDYKNQIVIYQAFPKMEELCGNELAERNLEYYLEGLLRRRMFWSDNAFKLPDNLTETDRIVLRLLNIDCLSISCGTSITNPVSFLQHIKDDYNKSKINEDMIRISLKKSFELPQYTPGCKIVSQKEEIDWVLPGINPDINCLSPWKWEEFDNSINPQVRKQIRIVEYDSLGKQYSNQYRTDDLWEKLINNQ